MDSLHSLLLGLGGRALVLSLPRHCILCDEVLPFERRFPTLPLCRHCDVSIVGMPEPRCPVCGRPIVSEQGRCMDCRRNCHDFDESLPLFDFRGPAGALVAAYKFGGRRSLAPWFAGKIEATVAGRWPDRPIVPVPPRPGVSIERGWDHVELMAKILERGGHQVIRPLRRGKSPQQKSLGLEERRVNAARAYSLRTGARVPERVVLLDDVFTSGATADACARALREGGAREVAFVAIAAD